MVETKRTSLEQSALSTNYKTLSLRIESIRNIYLNSLKMTNLIILIYHRMSNSDEDEKHCKAKGCK